MKLRKVLFSQNLPTVRVSSALELKAPPSEAVRKQRCAICPHGCVMATMTVETFLMRETVQVGCLYFSSDTFNFLQCSKGSLSCFSFLLQIRGSWNVPSTSLLAPVGVASRWAGPAIRKTTVRMELMKRTVVSLCAKSSSFFSKNTKSRRRVRLFPFTTHLAVLSRY